MAGCNTTINDGCRLYINEHTQEITNTINSGLQSLGDRMLCLENAVKDINDIKGEVKGITQGNGVPGYKEFYRQFGSHLDAHAKSKERLWDIVVAYGGKALLVIVNLFLIYQLMSGNLSKANIDNTNQINQTYQTYQNDRNDKTTETNRYVNLHKSSVGTSW